jgi:mannose-6-phosphate isomerase-like protein (cupin superfamily)
MFIKKINPKLHIRTIDQTRLSEIIHPIKNPKDPTTPYSLAHAFLLPGTKSTPHRLTHSTETLIFTKGTGEITIHGEKKSICQRSIVVVSPGEEQFIYNNGPNNLEFYCIFSPPWDKNQDTSIN